MKEYSQKETIKTVLKYGKKYILYFILSILLAAVTVALTLYVPILTGRAIDLIVGKGNVSFDSIFAILKKIAIIVLITAIAQWLMNLCNNKMTYGIVRDIREKAFAKLRDLLGIEEYAATAIFIDPKAKPSDDNDRKLERFCGDVIDYGQLKSC